MHVQERLAEAGLLSLYCSITSSSLWSILMRSYEQHCFEVLPTKQESAVMKSPDPGSDLSAL